MSNLVHVDVCSGVGCFGIAAARAGFVTKAFCEIEPYPRKVLARHFPEAYIHDDIKTLTGNTLRERGIDRIDLFSGGFPCQDVSAAGKGAGLDGKRSGLWFELLRLIEETRPLFAVIENVSALRTRGADTVLAGLETAGYAAEACVVGAWAVGASHERERVWIVAHSRRVSDAQAGTPACALGGQRQTRHDDSSGSGALFSRTHWAASQPGMGRGHDGFAARLDGLRWPAPPGTSAGSREPVKTAPQTEHHNERLKACGNAIVWPVAAVIFAAIREAIQT